MSNTTEGHAAKPYVLFTFPNSSSFVRKDIEIISEAYNVITFEFKVTNKLYTPFVFLKQLLFLIRYSGKVKLFISQLAGYHTVLPVIFSKLYLKPSLIFLGGTDCARFPSIQYGNLNKTFLRAATVYSVKNTTHLSPKHTSLISFDYDYDTADFPVQGLKPFIKDFNTPYTVIYNGYDGNRFLRTAEKKPGTFLTVAAGVDMPFTIPLKGIDLMLKAAKSFPDCTFTIVGVPSGFQLADKPANLICYPEMKNEDLVLLYSQHAFYFQLSMSEGFPNAVCEAMLCECIPIVSNVNALPEIAGDTGYLLMKRDTVLLTTLISTALKEYSVTKGVKARERIMQHFTVQHRSTALLQLLKQLT